MTEELIHPDEAIRLAASFLRQPVMEELALSHALGRVLPQPIVGGMDQPPFSKAAMDGWAWRPATPSERESGMPASPLRARQVIAAGQGAHEALARGEAAKIMTGAPLPPGADRVQRVEWSELSEGLVRFSRPEPVDNVIRRGENAKAGDEILGPRLLRAQDLAILAADGRSRVRVAKRPIVGVLSTGTELAEPGQALAPGRIYDSNRPQILAQLTGGLCELRDLGGLTDDYEATLEAVRGALGACELLILSGGVSMGDYDYVPRALAASGVERLFHGVAMKPGKPTFFGRARGQGADDKGGAFVFGLPGNPVSVFVNTELLVKTLLYALCGLRPPQPDLFLPLTDALRRKGAERVEFLPVALALEGARPIAYGGSSAIQALAGADGFARMEIGQAEIEKGGLVRVRLVR